MLQVWKLFSDTEFIWNGEFRNKEHGYVTIIAKDGAIYGQINIEDEIYSLQDLGNGKNALIQIDETIYGPSECATPHEESQGNFDNSQNAELKSACNSNVRVLVLFTNAANQVGNPQNDANLFISQTRQARKNSEIENNDLTFELVGVEELVGFVENADNIVDDRDRLREGRNNNAPALRNQFEADLVVLLTDGDYGNNNIFGIAFLDEVGDRDFGYAIAEIDAAGGRYTFAHEVAHLFGARHDNDWRVGANLSPFAHGHSFTKGIFWWKRTRRTILNSLPQGESRIKYYSNPDVEFDKKPTGTSTRDNARQLEARACDVADYRFTAPPMYVHISGPGKGYNSGTYTWCAVVNNCNNIASYNWEYSVDGFTYSPFGTSQCRTASLPFNSNLYLRLTVTCSDGQTATSWRFVLNLSGGIFKPMSKTQKSVQDEYLSENIIIKPEISVIVIPNPSSGNINIETALSADGLVKVSVLDLYGRIQKVISSGYREAGMHYFSEDLSGYQPGLYILRIEQNGNSINKKILVK